MADAVRTPDLIRVHPDGHYLEHPDETPFFWLGDTAWELFHRLTREEIVRYLDARAAQGFNVVQAVGLAELDGLKTANREGHLPLQDLDPARPNEPYWELVDFAVREAYARGIYIALLPTWGDKFCTLWGDGPAVFTRQNARAFGEWIGARYGAFPNVIWVMGGDRPVQGEDLQVVRAMAEGVRETEGEKHLMTLHPMGGQSSSAYVHGEPWLDFHMFQSGHGWFTERPDRFAERDWHRSPTMPVLDGEPCYENHRPFRGMHELKDLSIPPFMAYHVRRACYQSVFAGGCGVTYGCHAIWQMYDGSQSPINHPIGTWWQSLGLPGAQQLRHLRDLTLTLGLPHLEPDQSLIVEGLGEGSDIARAIRRSDGSAGAVYFPWPRRVRLTDAAMQRPLAWFDPRTGASQPAVAMDAGLHSPTAEDWVLTFGIE
ncbi:MAG: DUF4038 domain-containing protein [Fimbriimonadaceae bacterium]|nr:DUF4038 domain-containing protein [Fimbriimonadaceae bacterium]